jgi:hypothetical protein
LNDVLKRILKLMPGRELTKDWKVINEYGNPGQGGYPTFNYCM